MHNRKGGNNCKELEGPVLNLLRSAARKVHAGLNVLADRAQTERSGENEEVTARLRRKVKGLKLEKECLERELDQAAHDRKEGERSQRENEDLKRNVGGSRVSSSRSRRGASRR